MIRVRDLTKSYAGAPILRGVSFDVAEGRIAAVLGKSGAGKSTLLRCLVGLEPFDAGTISVGDVEVHDAAGRAALRGRIGLVFQSFELFPHLSVLDNCTLAPVRVKHLPRGDAESHAQRLLADLGLADKLDAFPDHLSGGQRQRVAIARALAMQPEVLLYDEPTSALDASLRAEVHETLRRVRTSGVTQIVVTHDEAVVNACADDVFALESGVLSSRP